MRKYYLALLTLLLSITAFSQSITEIEPNNSFATAQHLTAYPDTLGATLGGAGGADYFKLNNEYYFQYWKNATVYAWLEVTNTAATGSSSFQIDWYNGLQAGGLMQTDILAGGPIPAGETREGYIRLCGWALDSLWLKLSSAGQFDYKLMWFVSYVSHNNEPNDTRATPLFLDYFINDNFESIGYKFRNTNHDSADWFKAIIHSVTGTPPGIAFTINADNYGCTPGQIRYELFKNTAAVAFASGFVGNGVIQTYEDGFSTVPLYGQIEVGDSLFVKISTAQPFYYNIRFSDGNEEFGEDEEFNDDHYNAILLAENQVRRGVVGGEHPYIPDEPDYYDVYKIDLAHDGAIKFNYKAKNNNCSQYDYGLTLDVLDSYGNYLTSLESFANWQASDTCNHIIEGQTKIRAFTAGTYYLALRTSSGGGVGGRPAQAGGSSNFIDYDYATSYIISYQFADSTGGDAEPNDDNSEATPLAEGENKKGHIAFMRSSGGRDYGDYYSINLSSESSLRIFVKGTYRSDDYANVPSARISMNVGSENVTAPRNPPVNMLRADSLYYDTVYVCGLPAGPTTFRISNSRAWEYEIRYEVADTLPAITDIEPNNGFNPATPINEGQLITGKLRYVTSPLDNIDYYRGKTLKDGKLQLIVTATNPGCGVARMYADVYDKRRGSGTLLSYIPIGGGDIAAGATVIDTLEACALAADTIYFSLSADKKLRYTVRYLITDTSENDIEPNNTIAEAALMLSGQTKKGHIYYRNGTEDTFDYYKIPFNSADTFRMPMVVTSRNCMDNLWLQIHITRKSNGATLITRYAGNRLDIDAGETVRDTIKVFVPAPDTLLVRVYAWTFSYELSPMKQRPGSNFSITGDTTACFGTQVYKAVNVAPEDGNATYNWSLPAGGGTITWADSIATVNWTGSSNRRVQLNMSNDIGTSVTKFLNVIVDGNPPSAIPLIFNFARTLSTNGLPPGTFCQWFRNGTAIPGANDSSFYAVLGGDYTVRFMNDCGPGPQSAVYNFPADALAQTINYPRMADQVMSQNLKLKLPASSTSGLGVYYQLVSGPGAISNDSLRITGAGTIIIKATQPGDDIYLPAAPMNDTVIVTKGSQVISFDAIAAQILGGPVVYLNGASTSGLDVTYTIVSGNASIYSGGRLYTDGAGLVTVRASQAGNSSYLAAAPVDRTFCIGVRTLTPIVGEPAPCLSNYVYRTQKIPGAVYTWTLSGGGILTTANNDTARILWQTPGTFTLKVKASSACDPAFTNEQEFVINTSAQSPAPVTNMQPADNSIDRQLPLKLSWIPGPQTVNYDLYVWDSAAAQPALPFATNIADISFTLPANSFAYNKTYKWRVISKNPCSQTAGPIQHFRLIPLPDLSISDVQAPLNATSGQTVTISWKVTNIGPGKTLTNTPWEDGVYLSFTEIANFNGGANWNPGTWTNLQTPLLPLLVGKKPNPTSLDPGQFYTNSISFTIPQNYSNPVYVYVIANNNHPNYPGPLQISVANDTARMQQPMNITLAPTPDLRVDSVFTPTATFSGSTVNLTYKVKNYGVFTPAGVSWADSVFISQNPLFDRNQSIFINAPKQIDNYYPNAPRATYGNTVQLLQNDIRTVSIPVVIPNFIFGTWFVYVKANANSGLYEGALNNNNVNRSQIQIYLTPTPKLTVSPLTVPFDTVSVTQPIGINFNIVNAGFTDNIEKNKAHHLFIQGSCPCYAPPGYTCSAPRFSDSLSQGSSYWKDRIYLSRDSSALNISTAVLVQEKIHGELYTGLNYLDFYEGCNFYPSPINKHTVITAGAQFPTTGNFLIPDTLAEGKYYIYVYTNPEKTVFEYPGTPQITRSTSPVNVMRPNLGVDELNAPPAVIGARSFNLTYAVKNTGSGVYNRRRTDLIYVSNFNSFDVSAQLIGSQQFIEDVPAGGSVSHSFTYSFPANTSGARYLYVRTNSDTSFRETTMANNVSSARGIAVTPAPIADLYVSNIELPDSVKAIYQTKIKYRINNSGATTHAGIRKDSLFISCTSTFNRSTAKFLAVKTGTSAIPGGGFITDSLNVATSAMSYELLSCFPKIPMHNAYFFVKTNADTALYEGTALANNLSAAVLRPFINTVVDFAISNVSAADTGRVGYAYPVGFTKTNVGYKLPNLPWTGGHYVDAVYFSVDSAFDNNDAFAESFISYAYPERGDTASVFKTPPVPNLPTGDYYVFVSLNHTDNFRGDIVRTNNVAPLRSADGRAKKVHIIRPLLPDLTDSIISSPIAVATGQPLTIVHRVKNAGAGPTYPNAFTSKVRLVNDFTYEFNNGAHLGSKQRIGVLPPGSSYNDTIIATLPLNTIPGNYVINATADDGRSIIENNELNNMGFAVINVFRPAPADLVVTQVTTPATVFLGYTADTIRWVVRNEEVNDAKGVSKDGIYFSKNPVFDTTASLVGIQSKMIDMQSLETDSLKLAPLVTDFTEGLYYVHVKTDVLNNIVEDNKANNSNTALSQINVRVKELPMNVDEPNTLARVARYYKLMIPDSLRGATLKLQLTSSHPTLARNEMFVRGSYVPTPAQYDYRYETPNGGNQQIIMSSVTDSVYYIMYRCLGPETLTQNVTLRAEKLPFAILNVNSSSGGNIGNVTVKIGGSLFRDSMVATISRPGTTVTATTVYFVNSTTVFATFPLQGKPLGVYDVSLTKPNGAVTTLPVSFSVVTANNGGLITGGGANTGSGNGNEPGCDPGAASGLNSQLVVELIVPARALTSRPVVVQIQYNNPTNYDIPIQTRTLYSEAGMKMALTRAGVSTGTTALYLELSEQNGPPGVIRPGGGGVINVYSTAPSAPPAPNGAVLFKLK